MTQATTRLRPQPLWVRVDENRVKVTLFVTLFVFGSALLLTLALVAVPGYLLGWGADAAQYADGARWYATMPWVLAVSLVSMLAVGALLAAIQLSNAEDWVRGRLKGTPLPPGSEPRFESSVADMALAAGLATPPRIVVLDSDSVNAFATGTTRNAPLIGVTRGLLDALTEDEERAVAATLTARIVAGDIMFGTALAALMGPLKAIRSGSGKGAEAVAGATTNGCADGCGHGCANADGCGDVGGCLGDIDSDGCGSAIAVVLFLALVAALTYAAVVSAAWIVTLWGRALHRTSYEKADAEGMLLLKDPRPMLSALQKTISSSNAMLEGDVSYDGIFYASVSGDARISRTEQRRLLRLAEVLGVEGAQAVGADRA